MSRKRRKKKENKILRILLIIITIVYGLYLSEMDSTLSTDKTQGVFNETSSNLVVKVLDVGQADSILIENNKEYMLIDAGNNEDGEKLVKYFEQARITNFKYVIGTHPHEDHIGGLDDVINNFKIETIYMPDVITTTKTFVDVLDAMDSNKITYKVPKIGDELMLGDALVKVLYVGSDGKELNNSSIVLKLVFGKNCFIFTGDAEERVEDTIIKSGLDISCDVLKVGHHGSRYSTTDEFLSKVNPKYAVISVGENNSYNHPEDIIIKRLKDNDIEIHRTDLEGTIVITTDGENINFSNLNIDVDG